MNKKKKVYLSSKINLKGIYKNKLLKRYNITYVDDLKDADYLIIPVEDYVTYEQGLDIDYAIYNRIKFTSINSKDLIEEKFNDLDEFLKNNNEIEKEREKLNDELDFGME